MPAIHQIQYSDPLEISEATKKFLYDYCPQHGQMGESEVYYIDEDAMQDLIATAKEDKLTLPDLAKIAELVKAEGICEFVLSA